MKLTYVGIENFRAIEQLDLEPDSAVTVLHGDNAHGKTSILDAIAVGLGRIPSLLPGVSGIGFRKTDRRESLPLRVMLTAKGGIKWDRGVGKYGQIIVQQGLKEEIDCIVNADQAGAEPLDLPIVAYYDANRAVFDALQRRRSFKSEFQRYAALEGALSARTNFKEFFKWFYAKENEELRDQKARRDFDFRLKDLNAVRQAIERMVCGGSNPRIELGPLRFVVSVESGCKVDILALNQLSGGFRIMLALAADLAWRMAQGNPHLEEPLDSEAIILIDEIELHLHPSWQQRVLPDLARTFPHAQFIVSTHSPQVLTTVRPEHIVSLRREDGNIVAEPASAPTYGAEAGDVLAAVMGVSERPSGNEFVKCLEQYMSLVGHGRDETEKAISLRRELESLSPRDPALDRADVEIRRRKLMKGMGKSK